MEQGRDNQGFYEAEVESVNISRGENIQSNTLTPTTLADVFKELTSDKHRPVIEQVRTEQDKDKRNAIKKRIPYFVPAGLFRDNVRKKAEWVEDSGAVILDVDEYDTVKSSELVGLASVMPTTLGAFLSPSGGLKVIVKTEPTDCTPEAYLRKWEHVKGVYEKELGVEVDPSGKDPSRACFFSYDRGAYYNPDADPLPIPEPEEPEEVDLSGIMGQEREQYNPSGDADRVDAYLARIYSTEGQNGSSGLMTACRAIVDGYDITDTAEQMARLSKWNQSGNAQPPWSDNELEHALDNVRKTPATKERGRLNGMDFPDEPSTTPQAPKLKLEPIKALDLMDTHREMKPVLIDGFLRRGETCNVIASPKTGKSWLVLQMALSVANGEKFLGLQTEKTKVLIIDNELHPETLADRIKKVSDVSMLPAKDISVISLRGQLRPLPELRDAIAEASRNMGTGLIVLDALYRLLPKDVSENDNAGMTQVYNELDKLASEARASIVVVHHTSKGGQADKSITDGGAGAGAISRASDAHILIREHEEEGAVVLDAVTRSFPPPKPLVARRRDWMLEVADDLNPEKLKGKKNHGPKSDSKPPSANEVSVPELGDPLRKDEFLGEMRELLGLTKTHAEMGLRTAVKAGKVKTLKGDRGALFVAHPDEPEMGTKSEQVRDYILENQETDPRTIADATGVSQKQVKRVLEELGKTGQIMAPREAV